MALQSMKPTVVNPLDRLYTLHNALVPCSRLLSVKLLYYRRLQFDYRS